MYPIIGGGNVESGMIACMYIGLVFVALMTHLQQL